MDLIQPEPKNGSPEPEPRYVSPTAVKTEHGQTWLRLVAAVIGAVLLVVIIVFLARWIYHKTHHAATPTPQTGQSTPAESSPNTASGAQPQTGGGSSSTSNPSQGTSNSSAPSQGSSNGISNTGPGNVVAIFVGSSLAAAGLHYIISIRKFSRDQA